jgi:hypothetical protein
MKAKRKPATTAKLPKNDTDADFLRKLGQAFRDQESRISDLESMVRITREVAFDVGQQAGGDLKAKGDLIFLSRTLSNMIDDFQREWYDSHKTAGGDEAAS